MKRIYKFIFIFMIIIFLNACNKRNENVNKTEYIYFNYNCNNKMDYHKCELKNSKINCDVEEPICEDQEFLGWYRANEYENPVDLTSKFNTNEIIYARWNDGSGEEPSSQQIEEPSSEEEPSSDVEEPSSYIPDEPSSNEQPSSSNEQPSSSQTPTVTKYNLTFDGNGGSTVPSSKSVAYNATLPSINEKPVRSWYTFMGWYDNKDYTKGTKYYNESNTPVKKYDKKANIKLYAGWKKNTLSIRYNGNGGVWNNPTKNVYSVNQYGTVTLKKDGSIFQEKYNYDENISTTGLLNYNGSYLNWKKDGYTVESKKEYIIQNGTATTVLDQDRSYTSVELAKYGGCDLSKKNCLITVKVNWNLLTTGLGSKIKVSNDVKTACNYVLKPDDLKIRLYRCPCEQVHADGTSTKYNCMYPFALPGGGKDIVRPGMGSGDLPYKTQEAKEAITFTRYQKGAFSYEEPDSIEKESTYEFAKSFLVLFRGDLLTDYRFKFNSDGEVIFPIGTCTQCYSEINMIQKYDSKKYKDIIDEVYNATKYFIMVNDDGSLTKTEYRARSTAIMKEWSKKGSTYLEILKKLRTSTESDIFTNYYTKSNIYDCRNLLVK